MRHKDEDKGWKRDHYNDSSNERKWQLKNKKKRNQQKRERRKDPIERERQNKLRNKSQKKRYERLRETLMKILGGTVCVKCGFKDIRALQFEHIHNDGHIDKKRFSRHDQFMRYYIENPMRARDTLQVYCANCNQIKLYE